MRENSATRKQKNKIPEVNYIIEDLIFLIHNKISSLLKRFTFTISVALMCKFAPLVDGTSLINTLRNGLQYLPSPPPLTPFSAKTSVFSKIYFSRNESVSEDLNGENAPKFLFEKIRNFRNFVWIKALKLVKSFSRWKICNWFGVLEVATIYLDIECEVDADL